MDKVGMKLFYENTTGNVIVTVPSIEAEVVPTIAEYIQMYPILRDRDPESFGMIQLEYGQYAEDFFTASSWRVNLETKTLEFSYPDPSNPEQPTAPQPPLTAQVAELKAETAELNLAIIDVLETLAGGGA